MDSNESKTMFRNHSRILTIKIYMLIFFFLSSTDKCLEICCLSANTKLYGLDLIELHATTKIIKIIYSDNKNDGFFH